MMHIDINAEKISPIKVYFYICFLSAIIFFVFAFIFGYDAFNWIVMHHFSGARFTDYFRHITACSDPKNLYWSNANTEACFPPLAYVMYFFLNKIALDDNIIPQNYETTGYNLFIFLFYSIVSVFILYNSILFKNRAKLSKNFLLTLSLLFSIPFFMGCIERGNSTLLVLSLLIIFYKMHRSESCKDKFFSIILLSICIGFKIYPAIFSLLYIKQRRYKEFAILFVVSLVLFFWPFVFFGGVQGFVCWYDKILSMVNQYKFGRIEDIKAIVYTLQCTFLGRDIRFITKVSPYIFLIVCIFLILRSNDKFNELFLLCAIMTFFPSQAFRYSLSYFAIPLICFAEQINTKKIYNYFMCTLYGLLFSIPSLLMAILGLDNKIFTLNGVTYTDIYLYFVAYIQFIFVCLCVIKENNKLTQNNI